LRTGKAISPSQIAEDFLGNPRRLRIAHFCLGIFASFAYWVRADAFNAPIHTPRKGDGLVVILGTILAWAPYLISLIVSQKSLSLRPAKATVVFIASSVVVAIVADSLYLNLHFFVRLPPVVISMAVTIPSAVVTRRGIGFSRKGGSPRISILSMPLTILVRKCLGL
jgi:hypothetical protein